MATRVLGPTGSKRRRRFLLVPILLVALASLFVIVGAQASPPEQAGFFELDKNLINNEQTPSSVIGSPPNQTAVALGTLGGNINSSVTSFTVCQAVATNPTPLPITIQVDAERMTVGAITNATGGGCSGAFKRTYSSVTRGADVPAGFTTDAASHGASGVSGFVTRLTFNTVAGDDWDQVKAAVDANGSPTATNPNPCSGPNWTGNTAAQACDFIHDDPGKSVFTTGGSKDDLDINTGTAPNITHNWMWTDSSVPDADDITDGYAIKYQAAAAGSHQFLYFGADRVAVNGSKDMGFWFFKSPVSQNPDGTFSGQHTVGDILLLSTFTGGGATTTIRIFKWVGPNNGADTNGVLLSGGNFGDCVPGGSSDGCDTVNNGTIHSPWAYQSKISGTPANTIYAGGAMEGGVDLTSLKLTGCFSSFLAETRSAPEVGAQLKDFLLGTFESCGSTLKTTPKDGNGSDIPAGGLSIGTGSVQAKDSADLQVTGTGDSGWSGTFKYFICGPVSSDTCDPAVGLQIGATQNVDQDNAPALSDAATLTKVGRYCWAGVFTSATQGVDSQTDKSAGECFTVNPVTPTLTTTAVKPASGLSPTIVNGLADMNGDGVVDSSDDSSAFYGDTSIIDGHLDCNNWASANDGAAGDGAINGLGGPDDCTLIGVPNVTIQVVGGVFQTGDGPLPTVFNAADPTNPSVVPADFAWSTIFGKVDSNGNGSIGGTDCSFNVIGDADILGNDASCGSGQSNPNSTNGKVDLNGDGKITAAGDSCTDGCFLGQDVANGLIVAGTVPFGQSVYDVATLTGTANQPGSGGPNATYPTINPTIPGAVADGTITFTLVGPDGQTTDCTTLATSDNASEQNPQDVTVAGDGDYQTLAFTPNKPGDYHWKATYSGDPPPPASPLNTLGTSHNNACNEAGEDVTVEQIPTVTTTRQFVFPQDKVKINTNPAGKTLSGNVSFRLFEATGSGATAKTAAENCLADDGTATAAGLVYSEGPLAISGAGPQTKTTSNQTYRIIDGRTYVWRVIYTSSDPAQLGSSSNCTENTAVTFGGNDSSIDIP
jgi:hypothetical protein